MIKSINITKQNYLDYSRFAIKRLVKPKLEEKKNSGFLKNLIVWFLVTVIFMAFFQIEHNYFVNFHWQSSLFTAIPFAILIIVFLINLQKSKLLCIPNENGSIIGNKTIEFLPEGINEINSFGHSFYRWEVVEAIEENKGNIYIFVDKLLALIIPSESFTTSEEKEELKVLIQKYV
jgi:hypothetical protein